MTTGNLKSGAAPGTRGNGSVIPNCTVLKLDFGPEIEGNFAFLWGGFWGRRLPAAGARQRLLTRSPLPLPLRAPDRLRLSNSSYETGYETPPETKLETKVFTKLFRFCFLPSSSFLGISNDTKFGYETPMWVFVGTFVSEFRIRTSFPPIQN